MSVTAGRKSESKISYFVSLSSRCRLVFAVAANLVVATLLAACNTEPTKVYDNESRTPPSAQTDFKKGLAPQFLDGANSLVNGPIVIDEITVVLDVRPNFDYSLSHIPRSVVIQWDEFSQHEPKPRGLLDSDLFAVARRLARLGVAPEKKIVVVGQGLNGNGEEGRVAWMLRYLGLNQVQYVDLDTLKVKLTTVVTEKTKNAPIWKPEVRAGLNCTKEEIRWVINNNGFHVATRFPGVDGGAASAGTGGGATSAGTAGVIAASAGANAGTASGVNTGTASGGNVGTAIGANVGTATGGGAKIYRLIDVRSAKEYLDHTDSQGFSGKSVPDLGAINIDWKNFLTREGRAKVRFRDELTKLGILPEHRILVIDSLGVRSGAATAALMDMGYPDVANCSGGYKDLLP